MLFSKKGQFEFLIAGLGNPGPSYANTRHNCGFMAADAIAAKCSARFKTRFNSEYAEITLGGVRGLLQKPLTFMNSSGEAVSALAKFYKIPAANVIIMHDDITLDPGVIKIKTGGSAGGHNGVASIIERLGSQDFCHIKIGIGPKLHKEQPLADFVLGIIPAEQREAINGRLGDIFSACELLAAGETEKAKAAYNK